MTKSMWSLLMTKLSNKAAILRFLDEGLYFSPEVAWSTYSKSVSVRSFSGTSTEPWSVYLALVPVPYFVTGVVGLRKLNESKMKWSSGN